MSKFWDFISAFDNVQITTQIKLLPTPEQIINEYNVKEWTLGEIQGSLFNVADPQANVWIECYDLSRACDK